MYKWYFCRFTCQFDFKNISNPLWISIHLESTFESLDINNKRHFYLSFVMRNFFFCCFVWCKLCKERKVCTQIFSLFRFWNLLKSIMMEKKHCWLWTFPFEGFKDEITLDSGLSLWSLETLWQIVFYKYSGISI